MIQLTKFPKLYHLGKKGKIHSWKIYAKGDTIVTVHGTVDGKKQISKQIAVGKNGDKKNGTTAEEQAIKEAKARWLNRLARKYSKTPEKAREPVLFPMLASDFKKRLKLNVKFPGHVQPKLDGVRCIARWKGKHIILLSRNGKTYNCPHVIKELEKFMPKDMVLDGELYVHGVKLQTILSWVKRLQKKTKRIKYHIYDMPEFEGDDTLPWLSRYKQLMLLHLKLALKAPKYIQFVETVPVEDAKGAYAYQKKCIKLGYEGAIFRNLDGIYEYGMRSYNLLKLKSFDEHDFKIVGYKQGIGKEVGAVIWICRVDKKQTTSVRPQGTYAERRKLYKRANSQIGKILKVKHFGYTKDGVPWHPVGLTIRLDKDI